MKHLALASAIALAFTVSACTNTREPLFASLGQSVKSNADVMVDDATPLPNDPKTDAGYIDLVIDLYQSDTVKRPDVAAAERAARVAAQ